MEKEYLKTLEEGTRRAIEHLKSEINNIHTGRASTHLVSEVMVDAYGTKSPLKQVANITVTDSRSIAIQPWDRGNMVQIESSLRESGLGFGVTNSGDMIRVNIPELTEERRTEYIKMVKEKAEETKITIRNVRHEIWENTKRQKNSGEITEDDMYRREEEINKLVELKNKEIDRIFADKEKELKEV